MKGRKILPISKGVHPFAIYCIVAQIKCILGKEIKLMPTRTGCQDFETAKNFNKHFWSYVWPLLPLQNLETKPFDNH